MIITIDQVFLHFVGDYVLQSHWMAQEKRRQYIACLVHAFCYQLPFLWLTNRLSVLAFIMISHLLIDYYALARYVIYAKNLLSPVSTWAPWSDCRKTGFPSSVPDWLAVWLLIIVDNVMHVACNAFALKYL